MPELLFDRAAPEKNSFPGVYDNSQKPAEVVAPKPVAVTEKAKPAAAAEKPAGGRKALKLGKTKG